MTVTRGIPIIIELNFCTECSSPLIRNWERESGFCDHCANKMEQLEQELDDVDLGDWTDEHLFELDPYPDADQGFEGWGETDLYPRSPSGRW